MHHIMCKEMHCTVLYCTVLYCTTSLRHARRHHSQKNIQHTQTNTNTHIYSQTHTNLSVSRKLSHRSVTVEKMYCATSIHSRILFEYAMSSHHPAVIGRQCHSSTICRRVISAKPCTIECYASVYVACIYGTAVLGGAIRDKIAINDRRKPVVVVEKNLREGLVKREKEKKKEIRIKMKRHFFWRDRK